MYGDIETPGIRLPASRPLIRSTSGDDAAGGQQPLHTFSFCTRPRRPCGRKSRTRIRIAKAIASR